MGVAESAAMAALGVGGRFGPFDVTGTLGVGGMGEVYRARDTRLKREVALKILPEAVATDPDRLAHFQREAEVLASLNHPNIAAIYGLEESDGIRALVMELVEGETLADRIARGAIPLDEVLPVAKQIAEALEAAHEQGIIHRDLKPANIKLRPDGTVKVLDFGLAKLSEAGYGIRNPGSDRVGTGFSRPNSISPTITSPALMTGVGVLLGTAAYMSPEQAKGRPADKRSDIWAFGCVLYEMLTGRRAFEGEDVADTLANVMKVQPDWTRLPRDTPDPIRRLLRRCLDKDRPWRLADAAAARLDIRDAHEADDRADSRAVPRRPTWTLAAAVAIGAVAASTLTWMAVHPSDGGPRPVTTFEIPLTSVEQGGRMASISPDGRQLVYAANRQLYARRLDRLESVPIRGTEGFNTKMFIGFPKSFFSPDGTWLAFYRDGQLLKVASTGGAPVTICAVEGLYGGSWEQDDTILFSQGASGIWRVSAAGGVPENIVKIPAGLLAQGPHLLPGGREVLFALGEPRNMDRAQIVLQSLDTGARRVLIAGGTDARYVPSGHLLYATTGGVLMAAVFDVGTKEVKGTPVALLENVSNHLSGDAEYGVSSNGTLAYIPSNPSARTLAWVDRVGHETAIAAEPRTYSYPRLSPDATRVAVAEDDRERDIWIWELARSTLTRLTVDGAREAFLGWSPDSHYVAFGSDRTGSVNLYRQAADGTGTVERLTMGPLNQYVDDFTPDGKAIIFRQQVSNYDLMLLPLDGDGTATPLVSTPFNEVNAQVSPNGRWMVYQSDQSGRDEVYVRPFPRVDAGRWQVSTNGGTRPVWSRDGRELFYIAADGTMMAVAVSPDTAFTPSTPTKLFSAQYVLPSLARHYDVAPDGRFLVIKAAAGNGAADAGRLVVVENWLEELNARVPVN
jgi:eukaryotic-like serine/threonine-protein kinase